ncbi:hypothetical protein M408DRAFT_326117 [Serendipita vermifera MAFF 305830]|uniref:Uncharacterized protein n=1 Tax=Serendipita vermifera MAFF 305830 TaxID=933852 RepID=A0A0C2X5H7_SERVB|nr:hypothetical protein M408DRAFT_326117 [Serendipita vermifera MAFF 305830]
MSASADNSMWSPVNEASYISSAYALSGYYEKASFIDEINIEYPPEQEPEYDPLIAIPDTEAGKQEKMKEIMGNLRAVVQRVEEEAAFASHLETFVKNAAKSNLAGEPQPTAADVNKIMSEFDGISLDEIDKGKKIL